MVEHLIAHSEKGEELEGGRGDSSLLRVAQELQEAVVVAVAMDRWLPLGASWCCPKDWKR